MTTKLHKLLGTAMLGLSLLSQSLPAWAGTIANSQVSIGYNGSTPVSAEGTLTGARYSADNQQYIGCESVRDTFMGIYCSAGNLLGQYVYCSSNNPRFMDAVKGMTDSSFVSFTSDPVTRSCTYLEVGNASYNLR